MRYFSSGCNWGGPVRITEPFYPLCRQEQIVITPKEGSLDSERRNYAIGDIVLLISGKKVWGIARIEEVPTDISAFPVVEEKFAPYNLRDAEYRVHPSNIVVFPAKVVSVTPDDTEGIRYNSGGAYYRIRNKASLDIIADLVRKYGL